MTKTGWIVALVVLLAIAGIGTAAYIGMKGQAAPLDTEQSTDTIPAPVDSTEGQPDSGMDASVSVDATVGTPAVTTVTYTDAGFSPEEVSVAMGGTVRFVNTSTHGMWVGSDDHPTHTKYDGTSTKEHCVAGKNTTGTFDACTALAPGTVYNFTFTKTGTFAYHNHTTSAHGGTVIVK